MIELGRRIADVVLMARAAISATPFRAVRRLMFSASFSLSFGPGRQQRSCNDPGLECPRIGAAPRCTAIVLHPILPLSVLRSNVPEEHEQDSSDRGGSVQCGGGRMLTEDWSRGTGHESNGCTGSTIIACWLPSAILLQRRKPRQKLLSTPHWPGRADLTRTFAQNDRKIWVVSRYQTDRSPRALSIFLSVLYWLSA